MKIFTLQIVNRLVNEKTGQVFFHVKTDGKKTATFIINASDLFNDLKMLEKFSPLDVREIAHAAMAYIEEIEDIFFKKNDAIFRISNKLTGRYKEISVRDLVHDGMTLTNLSKEDLCKVSYQLAVGSRGQ